MNSKLTAAQAARYWGCDVLDSFGDIYKLDASIMCEIEDGEQFRLLLTPLSAITDEHAIEVAKIASIGKYEAKECIGCDKDDYKTIGKYIVADFNYPTYIDIRIHTDKYIKIIDLLRSFGYDCDNAISEGWAVDKTTFDNK
jgi:hypothetical protein